MSTDTLAHTDQVQIYANVVVFAAWLTVLKSTTTGVVKPGSPSLVIAACGALRPLWSYMLLAVFQHTPPRCCRETCWTLVYLWEIKISFRRRRKLVIVYQICRLMFFFIRLCSVGHSGHSLHCIESPPAVCMARLPLSWSVNFVVLQAVNDPKSCTFEHFTVKYWVAMLVLDGLKTSLTQMVQGESLDVCCNMSTVWQQYGNNPVWQLDHFWFKVSCFHLTAWYFRKAAKTTSHHKNTQALNR